MCGIVGIVAHEAANQKLTDALTTIQHRGQDAAGILTSDGNRVYLRKDNGLVRDVIRQSHILRLRGNIGIGHVRYPTAGSESASESQPFYVNSPYGIALVHNGNLINTKNLAHDLRHTELRHLNTQSDSEVLLNVLAHELQRYAHEKLEPKMLFTAVAALHRRVRGAYSAIVLINGHGILAFRDPHGIRPLVFGKCMGDGGTDYMVVSESVALDALGYQLIDDVAPGEAIFIDLHGQCFRQQCSEQFSHNPCIFEYIYLARPDSVIDGISIYSARFEMGRRLATQILRQHPDHDIDVVIPIPDTSRVAALAVAQQLKVAYSEGFIKNRYIGRTFIMPGQSARKNNVRMKLNAIKQEFQGKSVLLVDDSIVRGTTSKKIIQLARDAGAKKVYFASAAPAVRYPNVYGIDMPTRDELIAHNNTPEEVADLIQADWLVYQSLEDVMDAINSVAPKDKKIERFEDSIFTGDYLTGGVDEEYLKRLAQLRSETARKRQQLLDELLWSEL